MQNMNIQESLNSSKESAHHYDAMLQAFAAVAERSTLELGVTLNVKGLIITGFIISQENYFNALIEGLESIDQDNDLKESLQDFLAQLKDKMVGGSAKGKQTLPKFIHLRNVKIYPSEGKGMPTYGDALWRGKIDAVDGFSLGEMVPAKFENVTPPI
jgi:hypothetical protein